MTIPVSDDQILYVKNRNGEWKLTSKISPIGDFVGYEFKGYVWQGAQAYACFNMINAEGAPGTRRPRPRGNGN